MRWAKNYRANGPMVYPLTVVVEPNAPCPIVVYSPQYFDELYNGQEGEIIQQRGATKMFCFQIGQLMYDMQCVSKEKEPEQRSVHKIQEFLEQ